MIKYFVGFLTFWTIGTHWNSYWNTYSELTHSGYRYVWMKAHAHYVPLIILCLNILQNDLFIVVFVNQNLSIWVQSCLRHIRVHFVPFVQCTWMKAFLWQNPIFEWMWGRTLNINCFIDLCSFLNTTFFNLNLGKSAEAVVEHLTVVIGVRMRSNDTSNITSLS